MMKHTWPPNHDKRDSILHTHTHTQPPQYLTALQAAVLKIDGKIVSDHMDDGVGGGSWKDLNVLMMAYC